MILFLHKVSGFPSNTEPWNDLFDFLLTRKWEEAGREAEGGGGGGGGGGKGEGRGKWVVVVEVDEIRGLWRGLERKKPIAVNAKLLPQKEKKKKEKKTMVDNCAFLLMVY